MIHKTDRFSFFPKFLLMLALTLLVFASQASTQGLSVSLEHVSDTPGMVSGQGTTITVRISQTGVNDFPGIATAAGINIDVAFDASVVNLATSIGFFQAATATGATLTLVAFPGQPLRVPDSADLTFTTVADVTDMEFTIGITGASTIIAGQEITIPLSETIMFNSVRSPELMADATEVSVPAGGTATATVTAMNFAADATITFDVQGEEQVTTSQDGATLTLTASGPAEVTVTASDGTTTTAPVTISFVQGALTLALAEGSMAENTVLPGGIGMATVMASGQAEGAEVTYRLEDGSEGVTLDGATVTASGAGTAIVTAWVGDVGSNAVTIVFNSVDPSPLDPQLHLDTQIESPAQNNSVLTFTDKRPGDTLQIQLFVPNSAGQDIQAFTLELALQGKTFANFIGNISGSDWMGEALFSGLSASDNPTLSGLFLNAAPVPMTGYLGQIDLEVTGLLSDEDTLRVTSAFLAVAGEGLQSVDVSNAELSFTPASICPGDFDDNGIVNMADFLLFGDVDVFGTRAGDATYNALMDMDSNGTIDVADFLLFVDVFNTSCEDGQPIVYIPDANLRAVIEDKLGKASDAPITPAEMATLTRLDAPNLNISDLKGLEYATDLTILNLGHKTGEDDVVNSNNISDLSPLSNLTSLNVLYLYNNSISDISSLSNLTNLSWLDLSTNAILDISSLSGLTNLSRLWLDSNSISDVSALSNLTNLTRLELNDNSISDVSALSNLTNLTRLELNDNSISDLSPLVANTGLGSGDEVDVRNNPLSATSRDTHVPALQTRGVDVRF